MKRLLKPWLLGASLLSWAALAEQDNFENALWGHHEDLSQEVTTDDLSFSVPSGGSLKGVTDPHAIMPGYDPDRPATTLTIRPRNSRFFSLQAFEATDLFHMPDPQLRVSGFRGSTKVVQQTVGPFWSDDAQQGVVATLSGFEKLTRVEITANVDPLPSSDLFFFLESVSYQLQNNQIPQITGSDALSLKQGGSLTLSLDHLQVSDSDNNYPADFTLGVEAGANYTVDQDLVTPDPDFSGTLSVGVTVFDGFDQSAIYFVPVQVNKNIVPQITAANILSVARDQSLIISLADIQVADADNSFPTDFSLTVLAGEGYQLQGHQITPDSYFVGGLSVPVVVSDGIDQSAPFAITVNVIGNHRPVISQVQPIQSKQGQAVAVMLDRLTVVDPDHQFPDDFTLQVFAGDNYQVAGSQLTPDADFIGQLQVPVAVSDGMDTSEQAILFWTVVENIAPKITAIEAVTIEQNSEFELTLEQITVDDPDNQFPDDFTFELLPGDNYQLDGKKLTPKQDFSGELQVLVVVSDGQDQSEPWPMTVTVTKDNGGGGVFQWVLLVILFIIGLFK